jgi:DNA-binding NarL/FixJ family response regulator
MPTQERDGAVQTVVALAPDLFFAGKIRGAATALGVPLRLVNGEEQLLVALREPTRVVLVDLEARGIDAPAAIRAARAVVGDGARIIGFASHVNTAALGAGRAAGADRVLARSAFARELPALLRGESGEGQAPGE